MLNARSFEKQGFSMVIEEEELTPESFLAGVSELYENRRKYIDAMDSSANTDSTAVIVDLIKKYTKQNTDR